MVCHKLYQQETVTGDQHRLLTPFRVDVNINIEAHAANHLMGCLLLTGCTHYFDVCFSRAKKKDLDAAAVVLFCAHKGTEQKNVERLVIFRPRQRKTHTVYKKDPDRLLPSLGPSSFKMTVVKKKTVLWSDDFKKNLNLYSFCKSWKPCLPV